MFKSVNIVNRDGVGEHTHVYDTATNKPLMGIEKLEVVVVAKEPVRAKLYLGYCEFNVFAKPELMLYDPRTGEPRRVRSITFDDGEVWEMHHGG